MSLNIPCSSAFGFTMIPMIHFCSRSWQAYSLDNDKLALDHDLVGVFRSKLRSVFSQF